jgi:SSS family transporter
VAGIRAKGKTHTFEDYMVAGRKIGPVLLGISFGVTYFSAVMIIGGGEFSFIWGLSSIWIAVIDVLVGVFAIFLLFGNRTMKLSEELNCLTVSEMLGKRYKSEAVQMSTALITLVFETIYLVSIYMGLSILLQYAMPDVANAYEIAVIVCGVVTIVYLNVGGAHGTITTDIAESIIMLAAVAFVFFIGLRAVGGLDGLIDTLTKINSAPGKDPQGLTHSPPSAAPMAWVGYILVTSFGVWGMPQMISRYFTSNQKKSIKGGLLVACLWALAISLLAWWNGAIGRAYYTQNGYANFPKTAAGTPKFDEVVPMLMKDLMPVWMIALFFAAITAASLTTGEKVIMVASSAFSRDFVQLKTKCSDEKALMITKVMNVVVVVVGILLALEKPDAVLALCMFAWAALSAAILVPYIFGLFWKKGTAKAAFLTGILAMLVAILWKAGIRGFCAPATGCWQPAPYDALNPLFPLFPIEWGNFKLFDWTIRGTAIPIYLKDIHEFIVAQIAALIIFPVVSLATQKDNDKEYVDKLFNVMTGKAEIGSSRAK